ncbi:MAG: B12-binding domain-containing radical SAM protein [bacterium]|nr:B12-binding domain-containing radical SAM protein [bacterium]
MNILFLTSAAPVRTPIPTGEKRPPLGLGYLMAVLKQQGHNIFFSDEYLKPSTILESDFLQEKNIDFVGIYSNTICYSSTLAMFEILREKREKGRWKGKIMVGGPHTAFGYNDIPSYVDHIVIGEGEVTVPKIVNGEIKERIIRGEKVPDLDSLPFPTWEEFIHLPYMWWDRRIDGVPLYTFNTSRGCPYNCTFCSVKGVWGKNYRYMSAERVINDMEYMKKVYGMKAAFFREDHFTLNKKRTVAVCDALLKRNMGIFWMCESRADSIDDPAVVELMAKSGCKTLYIGVESGSPRMLELFKKDETVEQFIRVFDYAKTYGIKMHASFVVGAPGETGEDRALTDDLIKRIKPDTVRKNVFIGLPGSELYEYANKNNLYEYREDNGILYLKGYHNMVDQYYEGNPDYKTYDPTTLEPGIGFNYFKQHRKIEDVSAKKGDLDISLLEDRYNMQREQTLLEAYLEEIIKTIWNTGSKKKNIALYGAGTHSQLVLRILKRLSLPFPRVVFDRNPQGALVEEVSVDHIDNVSDYNITDIMISNDRKHYEIYNDLLQNPALKGVNVLDPYFYLPHAPYRS